LWLKHLRLERGWTRPQLAAELRATATTLGDVLPEPDSLIRMISFWENSARRPSAYYGEILRRTFGLAEDAESRWVRRHRVERLWTAERLVHEMKTAAAAEGVALPKTGSVLARISRWENGHHAPNAFYAEVLRRAFRLPGRRRSLHELAADCGIHGAWMTARPASCGVTPVA
jgi:transcriptional regulator with XRE-family HTH domain